MIRMQIQLTEEQAAALRRRANVRRVSMAAVVRDAVDRELAGETSRQIAWERALAVVGKYRSGTTTTSVDHNSAFDEGEGD